MREKRIAIVIQGNEKIGIDNIIVEYRKKPYDNKIHGYVSTYTGMVWFMDFTITELSNQFKKVLWSSVHLYRG